MTYVITCWFNNYFITIIHYYLFICTNLLRGSSFVEVNLKLNDDLVFNSDPIKIISRLIHSLWYHIMMLNLVKYNLLAQITNANHIQTYGGRRSKDLTRFDVVVSGSSPDTGVCTGWYLNVKRPFSRWITALYYFGRRRLSYFEHGFSTADR